jgi:predicted nucleic acid-binding protein
MRAVRTHYFDASALVKLFLVEQGTEVVREYFNEWSNFCTTSLCFVETLQVFKKRFEDKEITLERYLAICEDLVSRVAHKSIEIDPIDLTNREIYLEVEKVAQSNNLDIADAFLVIALKLGWLSFLSGESRPMLITADNKLTEVAREEGLYVWNCVKEPAP